MGKPLAVGCHIYAGGFTLGLREHFDVPAHVECIKFGAETSKKNLGVDIHVGPPPEWVPYLRRLGLQPAVVFGNPPCSGFSVINNNPIIAPREKVRGVDSVINDHIWETVRFGVAAQATAIVVESVQQFVTTGWPLIRQLCDTARGYNGSVVLVNALNHGVAQNRRRVFFVLTKDREFTCTLPDPGNMLTVRDAIEDLAEVPIGAMANHVPKSIRKYPGEVLNLMPTGTYMNYLVKLALINDIPELRGIVEEHGDAVRGGRLTKLGFMQPFRLNWDLPSLVIVGGMRLVHPSLPRFLSPREVARLNGFPDTYEFTGGPSNQYAEIGKGIPPPMGEWIGMQLYNWLGNTTLPDADHEWRDGVKVYDFTKAGQAAGYKIRLSRPDPYGVKL